MSHLYADIQGNRGGTSRGGSKDSGINGHIRGWKSGASVSCYVDHEGRDVVEVSATNGSGHGQNPVQGLVFRTINGKIDFLTTKKRLLGK